MSQTIEYEAYALRYAARPENRRADTYLHFELLGQPDQAIGMDYFFWVLRSPDRVVLVDCGFSRETGAPRRRYQLNDPVDLLGRIGLKPHDVDHVVLTHMHYDHVGNTDLFPAATFSMARPELEYWTGPHANHPALNWPVERREIDRLLDLQRAGRLNLVEEASNELFPGIRVERVPGHTPGQLIAQVQARGGSLVLTSDAVHYDEEMNLDLPFHAFTDLVGMLNGYQRVRELAADPRVSVIPGHEPGILSRYTLVADDVVDLCQPTSDANAPRASR